MAVELGKWAVIDLETSGTNPLEDEIIDVGFLQFENDRLVRRYESLVKYPGELSHFIQKLTGISQKMASRAPDWAQVEPEVMELYGHALLAHNAEFEQSFLAPHFDKIADESEPPSYWDSIPYLGLLFPFNSHLGLERFIVGFGLADKESHRGLEDALDLLKVLLVATSLVKRDREWADFLSDNFKRHNLQEWWYARFFQQSERELENLAEAIELDLAGSLERAREWQGERSFSSHADDGGREGGFSLEFNSDDIGQMYRSSEKVRSIFSGYRYRKSQEDLSLRVGQALKNDVHALIQAPTGTGKTLGYLIPAALFSRQEGERVLIATGTKTLQKQAMEQDIPQLKKLIALGDDFKVTRLVGSGNHLCELLFREEGELVAEENFAMAFLNGVFFQNARSKVEDQILRDDLPYVLKKKLPGLERKERSIAVDFRACTGQRCPLSRDCSYVRTLREAKEANVVIGNHSLMFSWPKGFPRPSHIVVDEAHRIERESTDAFTLEASQGELESLPKSLRNLQGLGSLFYLLAQNETSQGESTAVIEDIKDLVQDVAGGLEEHLDSLPECIETWFKKRPRYTEEYWNEVPMPKKDANESLQLFIYKSFESVLILLQELLGVLLPHLSRFEENSSLKDEELIAFTRFRAFVGTLEDLVSALQISLSGGEKHAHSLRFHQKRGFLVSSAPIDVGQVVHDQLLETSSSVIFTSATLGNTGGDFGSKGVEWATGYSYLNPEKRFRGGLFLPPSYDYEKKMRVFLCDDVPPLFMDSFVPETLGQVTDLIEELGGRTLLLYGARKRFEVAREILLKKFEGKIPVFVQGMGSNVVENFKSSPQGGILLGMESFGEGIDVPGERLQFLFVDKIPDLRMERVIDERRTFYQNNLGNEFSDYYLAHRARSLHQKLGRLIRRDSDIGGAIVVDRRIKKWKGGTIQKFLKLMAPYRVERCKLKEACEQVKAFL